MFLIRCCRSLTVSSYARLLKRIAIRCRKREEGDGRAGGRGGKKGGRKRKRQATCKMRPKLQLRRTKCKENREEGDVSTLGTEAGQRSCHGQPGREGAGRCSDYATARPSCATAVPQTATRTGKSHGHAAKYHPRCDE